MPAKFDSRLRRCSSGVPAPKKRSSAIFAAAGALVERMRARARAAWRRAAGQCAKQLVGIGADRTRGRTSRCATRTLLFLAARDRARTLRRGELKRCLRSCARRASRREPRAARHRKAQRAAVSRVRGRRSAARRTRARRGQRPSPRARRVQGCGTSPSRKCRLVIVLTRPNGQPVMLNCDLIESVEKTALRPHDEETIVRSRPGTSSSCASRWRRSNGASSLSSAGFTDRKHRGVARVAPTFWPIYFESLAIVGARSACSAIWRRKAAAKRDSRSFRPDWLSTWWSRRCSRRMPRCTSSASARAAFLIGSDRRVQRKSPRSTDPDRDAALEDEGRSSRRRAAPNRSSRR